MRRKRGRASGAVGLAGTVCTLALLLPFRAMGACPATTADVMGYCWVNPTAATVSHAQACSQVGLTPTDSFVSLDWNESVLSAVANAFGYTSVGVYACCANSMWCNPTTSECGTHNFDASSYWNYGPYGSSEWWPVYTCVRPASVCGNAAVEPGEQCDDGNTLSGDGCDANCTVTACGNGIVTAGEQCDDGNLHDSDCCSSFCLPQPDGSVCDDALFCNGADTCVSGACSAHAGDPCVGGAECATVCREFGDLCATPEDTPCTDDGNLCTADRCDGLGACTHPNNDFTPCNDGLFCTGSDFCLDGTCSYHFGDPCAGNTCNDVCDEATLQCLPSTSGTACFEDGNECTTDQCDGAGNCAHPTIVGCSTRTPTPTRTRTRTRTPSPTHSVTPTGTTTATPLDTRTPTPQPAPASLVLRRVRLKGNTSTRAGAPNGTASIRGVVNANPPFDELVADVTSSGVSLRIAGAGMEMTLSWPAASCAARSGTRGARIVCDGPTAAGRQKLKLRPTAAPNVYALSMSAKQLGIATPRSTAPVRVVLITKTFARQDDIYECSVSGAASQVSVCVESGVVATPTPAPPLGERLFNVTRPGSALLSSIVNGLDVSAEPWLPATLRLWAGTPDVDGVAPLHLLEDTIVGNKIVNGQTLCMKIYAAGSHGRIDCDGGTAFDTLTTWDSNGAGPPAGGYVIAGGLGSDAGPGGADLFAGWAAYLLSPGSTIAECQNLAYYTTSRLDSFTTTTSTGTFINPIQGGTVTLSTEGQNFDCASWTQQGTPGRLVTPLLSTDTVVGDIVNLLVLSDAPSAPVSPAPTPLPTETATSTPSRTPSRTRTSTRTPPGTRTPTSTIDPSLPTPTPTPTIPFAFQSCAFGGTPSDRIVFYFLGVATAPVPFQGTVDVGCVAQNGGARDCTCAFGTVDPVFMIGVGVLCFEDAQGADGTPIECSTGQQVCGPTPGAVSVALLADADIGGCAGNADCGAQCEAYCAAMDPPRVRFSSGCESHCQGGDRADEACQCDRVGSATCEPSSTQDCPLGACEGRDNELDVDCHCQCIDSQAPPASPAGGFGCQVPTAVRIESSTPCDGADVLVQLPPICTPFTSDRHAAVIVNANEAPSSQFVPSPQQGTSVTCDAFDASPAGMALVSNLPYFDTTIGDVILQLSLTCQP